MKSFLHTTAIVVLSIILLFLLSGCPWIGTTKKDNHILAQNKALHKKNIELKKEITTKKELNANLNMKLLEKDAEINKLRLIQKDLGKEIVRSKIRMVFPKSKAEAVVILAEIETEINTAKEQASTGNMSLSFARPDQLMKESRIEFEQGSYNKACALAAQALGEVQAMQLQAEATAKPSTGPANSFVFPLVMQLVKTSNIREKPSMKGRILFILKRGERVTATGYHGHWIKITIKDQPVGWIYYSLLALPKS